jgi:hypothetical protein
MELAYCTEYTYSGAFSGLVGHGLYIYAGVGYSNGLAIPTNPPPWPMGTQKPISAQELKGLSRQTLGRGAISIS